MQKSIDLAVGEWTKGKFLMNPGFYAGCPPSLGILNSEMLEEIYQGLKKDVGQEAATNFVRFVNNLRDLSAGVFIEALREFHLRNYQEVQIPGKKEDRVRISGRGTVAKAQVWAVLAQTFSDRSLSEAQITRVSADIKQVFIKKHRNEIPASERNS